MARIFVDLSSYRFHFKSRPTPTGIQRVLAMLTAEILRRLGGENVFLSFYDRDIEKYCVKDLLEQNTKKIADCQWLAALVGVSADEANMKLLRRRYSGQPVANILHRAKIKYRFIRGHRSYFAENGVDLDALHNAKIFSSIDKVIKKGDIILLLDAGWDVPELGVVMRDLRRNGVNIISFIHDVIPISHPQFVSTKASQRFVKWLIDTTTYSCSYLTNSLSTRDELEAFLETIEVDTGIRAIPLAQETLPPTESTYSPSIRMIQKYPLASCSSAVRPLIGARYVLCVGSRDIRKNLYHLALAWHKLTSRLEVIPILVIAGGPGGGNDAFDDLMKTTAFLNGMIRIIDFPTDYDLDLLYRHCLFTIFPSLFEGWGLPIGESLSYGKCVALSNLSSMPEVAGSLGVYFDPTSVDSIVDVAHRLIVDEGYRSALEQQIRDTSLRSWSDVCADLLDAIGQTYPRAAL